jgi:hypothetical protein
LRSKPTYVLGKDCISLAAQSAWQKLRICKRVRYFVSSFLVGMVWILWFGILPLLLRDCVQSRHIYWGRMHLPCCAACTAMFRICKRVRCFPLFFPVWGGLNPGCVEWLGILPLLRCNCVLLLHSYWEKTASPLLRSLPRQRPEPAPAFDTLGFCPCCARATAFNGFLDSFLVEVGWLGYIVLILLVAQQRSGPATAFDAFSIPS